MLSISCFNFINAQEIKISSIPYVMHLDNAVSDVKAINNNHLRMAAPSNTDLFVSPDGKYAIDNSPRLLFKPDSDFIFTAKIKLEFKSKWDAGVMLIYSDSKHFAKFCFENDYKGQSRIVSVVCNDVADDCNSLTLKNNEVLYRITGSTKSNTFNFYYSEDEKTWFLIRSFRLDKIDNLQIGFSAQSPAGKECSVDFLEINLQQRKVKDFWQGE
jgi:uncharacterized protein